MPCHRIGVKVIIMAIDPGPHVGIAVRHSDGSISTDMIYKRYFDVWGLVLKLQPNVIVIERFRTAGRISADGLDTVEIQGSITSLAWILNTPAHPCLLFFHSPQMRYPMMTQAKQMLHASSKKIESHAVDALAHLLVWEHNHSTPVAGHPVQAPS